MKDDLLAEINITPLTDVILVLLIIVLLFAGAYSGLAAKAAPPGAAPAKTSSVKIALDERGNIRLENRAIALNELGKNLRRLKTAPLLVEAEAVTPYGKVLEVVVSAQEAGFYEINLSGGNSHS